MYQTLFHIVLTEQHKQTGHTIHYTDSVLPKPSALSIVQYDCDAGVYLLYLNELGCEQTDTYHESLQAAFEQAEFEFNVKQNEWLDIQAA